MSLSKSVATATLCLLILFVPRVVKAQPKGMRFDVPFGFYVGDKVLPAGSYLVELDKAAGYIELHNKTQFARRSIGAAFELRDGKDHAMKGRLTFYFVRYHLCPKEGLDGRGD
jgi:hypothetical protein